LLGSRTNWRIGAAIVLAEAPVLAAALTSEAAFHLTLVIKTSAGTTADGDSTIEAESEAIAGRLLPADGGASELAGYPRLIEALEAIRSERPRLSDPGRKAGP
jgi:hypothetical protein